MWLLRLWDGSFLYPFTKALLIIISVCLALILSVSNTYSLDSQIHFCCIVMLHVHCQLSSHMLYSAWLMCLLDIWNWISCQLVLEGNGEKYADRWEMWIDTEHLKVRFWFNNDTDVSSLLAQGPVIQGFILEWVSLSALELITNISVLSWLSYKRFCGIIRAPIGYGSSGAMTT